MSKIKKGKIRTNLKKKNIKSSKEHRERIEEKLSQTHFQALKTSTSFGQKMRYKISLKTKFALFISIFLISFILVWAIIISKQLEKTLFNNIKKNGANIVRVLSLFARDILLSKNYEDKKDWLVPLTNFFSIEKKKYENEILNMLIYRLDGNQPVKILDSGQNKKLSIPNKSYPCEIEIDGKKVKLDVLIAKGIYKDEKGHRITVYQFKKPIFNKENEKIGAAVVIMSAKKVDEIKKALLGFMVVTALITIVIGIIIALIMANIVTRPVKLLQNDMLIVSQGNLDHVTRPQSNDEIGELAMGFNEMTKRLKQAHEAEIEAHRLEQELKIAHEIQHTLLPRKIPKLPNIDFFATYKPAKEVGGDYYDYIPIGSEYLGLIVADVSGKGVPGSMVMSITRTLLRIEARGNLSTADTLKRVNKMLAGEIKKGMFVTAFYCILNVKTRVMSISSAGHNPMIVYRKKANKFEKYNPSGIALGFDKGIIFDKTIKEGKIQFSSGDIAVLYTDGVTEAMNENKEEYGERNFIHTLAKCINMSAKDICDYIFEELEKHRGKAEQHDDITISVVKFL